MVMNNPEQCLALGPLPGLLLLPTQLLCPQERFQSSLGTTLPWLQKDAPAQLRSGTSTCAWNGGHGCGVAK